MQKPRSQDLLPADGVYLLYKEKKQQKNFEKKFVKRKKQKIQYITARGKIPTEF